MHKKSYVPHALFYAFSAKEFEPIVIIILKLATICFRFSETVVTSVVTNNADVGREAEIDVLLPIEAFITNLTMRIDNETIVGNVEEKQKAKKIYDKVREFSTKQSSSSAYKSHHSI